MRGKLAAGRIRVVRMKVVREAVMHILPARRYPKQTLGMAWRERKTGIILKRETSWCVFGRQGK